MTYLPLSKLINKLSTAVSDNKEQCVLDEIGAEIKRRILLKHKRLSQYNNIYELQGWADAVAQAPEQIDTYLTDPYFLILVKRDIDIVHKFSKTTPSLYSKIHNNTLNVQRYPKKMIFTNPYYTDFKSLQSWSRPKSISQSYREHLASSNNRNKSKFLQGVDIKAIEYKLFSDAYGILYNEKMIFLYGLFDSEIGKLSNPNNDTTKFVKMQIDREPRAGRSGYYVKFHSYPIDKKQLQQDFGSNHPMIEHIIDKVFKI